MEQEIAVVGLLDHMMSLESVWETTPITERRACIEEFQERVLVLEAKSPCVPPITHFFGNGTYGREAKVQAGAVIVGSIYEKPQINVLIKGVVFVATEAKIGILKAPLIFVSDADTKKVGYVIEDMQWITIMSRDNNENDPDVILKEHITDTYGG